MTISFERPVGAAADLAELEYISALHQTQPGLVRTDGSIRDMDIVHFLLSRHGIRVDVETVRTTVLSGLGGDFDGDASTGAPHANEDAEEDGDGAGKDGGEDEGEDEDDEGEAVDLAEMVAILLIPTLIKTARREHHTAPPGDSDSPARAEMTRRGSMESLVSTAGADGIHRGRYPPARKKKEEFDSDYAYRQYREKRQLLRSLQPDGGLIQDVLTMILKDVTGSSQPKRITKQLMRDILNMYGEEELAEEGNLEDMVRAASGDGRFRFLDANAFACALTSDVLLYDPECEARVTSNYEDVIAAAESLPGNQEERGGTGSDKDDFHDDAVEKAPVENGGGNNGDGSSEDEEKLKIVFNAPAIDFVADQYMSKALVVLLWVGFVLVFFAYRKHIDWLFGTLRQTSEEVIFEELFSCIMLQAKYDPPGLEFVAEYRACIDEWWDGAINSQGVIQDWECPDINGRINYGCLILKSIVGWLYILGLLMFLGLLYIGLGSVGNSVRAKHKWPIIFGILFVGGIGYVFFFAFYEEEGVQEDIAWFYPNITSSGEVLLNSTDGTVIFEDTYMLKYKVEKTNEYETLNYILALVISTLAVLVQLFLMLGPVVKRCCFKGSEAAASFFAPGSIKAEAKIKQAAARKVNAMVKNAREVHGVIKEGKAEEGQMSYGQGLVNFSLQENRVEQAGGFLWTWKLIFSGELFTVEGVWISARIWSGNLAQILISLFIIVFGIVWTRNLVERWREGQESDDLLTTFLGWLGININPSELAEEATETIKSLVDQFMSLNHGEMGCVDTMNDVISDFGSDIFAAEEEDSTEICALLLHAVQTGVYNVADMVQQVASSAHAAVNSAIDSLSTSIYPEEEYMVLVPLIVTTIVAFLSGILLSLIYIPSVITTTLKLRSGVIPFFHDKRNQRELRSGMDQTTILLGSMFWGLLYSAALLGALVGGIVFLFLWQATKRQMAIIATSLIGLAITITVKMLIVYVGLRASVFRGYYRRKPTQGNIVSLILEVANIGYAISTALARAMKLIFITTLYIGRLDTPLLATGVTVGPVGDAYPTMFRKDILAHEAHRHPWLEIIGTMYLMKIRYGDKFGSKAGYCFRLIFAVALMPWIRKYRVMAKPETPEVEADGDKKLNNVQHSEQAAPIAVSTRNVMGASSRNLNQETKTGNESEEIKRLKAEVQRLRQALALGEENSPGKGSSVEGLMA